MLHLKQGNTEINVEILEFEYPPGWGVGTGFSTDYLITKIEGMHEGAPFEAEDSFFKFEELAAIYDECIRILDGDSFGFEAVIEDKRLGFYVEIEEGMLSVTMNFLNGEMISVNEKQTPVEFRAMTQGIYDALRDMMGI